jgi:uncharacterized protein
VSAQAATIRDQAGMFSPKVVEQAQAELNRIERENQIPITVETVKSLNGEDVGDVARRIAEEQRLHGLFILISKDDHKINVRASSHFAHAVNEAREQAIRQAFINEFKKKDYDAGLLAGVKAIDRELSAAKAANGGSLQTRTVQPVRRGFGGGRAAANPRGSFGIGSLLMLGLGIMAVLFLIRLIGSLFGANRGYGYGAPGGRPGGMGGPGYGYGGGGGGGGGFMSSLFGGLGGAMAGNWLYDQFSGRQHGGYSENTAYGQGADPSAGADAGPDDWSGGTSVSGDWGGGDTGGGDWGGGGGGGDWGGGGGDGGTGGDW